MLDKVIPSITSVQLVMRNKLYSSVLAVAMISLMVIMTLGGLFDSEEQNFNQPSELEKEELPLFASSPGHTVFGEYVGCLLYTSPSPRDRTRSRMPSSA